VSSPFFDTGALPLHESFRGLEELRSARFNPRREVLLVDTTSDAPDADLIEFLTSVAPSEGHAADPVELARAVANRMGGSVPFSDLTTYSTSLSVSELKLEAGSNVIHLGKVRTGTYYHRALLFKVAADHLRIPSVLLRSEYGRAYNVVYAPKAMVVDVMHEPGQMFPIQDLEQLAIPGNFFEFHRWFWIAVAMTSDNIVRRAVPRVRMLAPFNARALLISFFVNHTVTLTNLRNAGPQRGARRSPSKQQSETWV
jgi:hypothetical protein